MNMLQGMLREFRLLTHYKSLMVNLLKRDLHLKYRSSIMGYCWSFMNPLIMILTYVIAFKFILKIRAVNTEIDFAAQIIVGTCYWGVFHAILSAAPNCILQDAALLLKVRFPRIISVFRNHIFLLSEHFLIYPFMIAALYLYYKAPLTWNILLLLPFFLLYNLLILGLSLLISTMTVYFRDVAHFIGLAVQILFWLTPVVYPVGILNGDYTFLIGYTPAAPFIMSFYDILLNGVMPSLHQTSLCVLYSTVALCAGLFLFFRHQHQFAEEI